MFAANQFLASQHRTILFVLLPGTPPKRVRRPTIGSPRQSQRDEVKQPPLHLLQPRWSRPKHRTPSQQPRLLLLPRLRSHPCLTRSPKPNNLKSQPHRRSRSPRPRPPPSRKPRCYQSQQPCPNHPAPPRPKPESPHRRSKQPSLNPRTTMSIGPQPMRNRLLPRSASKPS